MVCGGRKAPLTHSLRCHFGAGVGVVSAVLGPRTVTSSDRRVARPQAHIMGGRLGSFIVVQAREWNQ
jgi:hypothetical protein